MEVKKKVIFETFVRREPDPFHSVCSFIDSGTIERKQVTLYLADRSHRHLLGISRTLSYLSAIGPGSLPGGPAVRRVGVQPLSKGLLGVAEEAADLLQMLAIGGRLAIVN